MARLTASQRRALPAKDFALGKGHYPIEDKAHARAALRMDHNATPAQRKRIEAAVHAKYPDIGGGHKTPEHHLNRVAHGTRK